MGLFTRRRNVTPEALDAFLGSDVWQPDGSALLVTAAADMDDDGCAGSEAFGARLVAESAPGASITFWCYPAYAGPAAGDGYSIGTRIEYRADDRDGEPWVAALYHGDDGDERWDDADSLAAELREGTAAFAATSRDEDSDDPAGWFDWDGSPW